MPPEPSLLVQDPAPPAPFPPPGFRVDSDETGDFLVPIQPSGVEEPQPFQPGQLSPQDAEEILRNLALASIPTQEARLGSALTDLLPQIQGSPSAVRDAVGPQISQIRSSLSQVFDAISQRLGRFGGGQIQRERGEALGAAGGQLQGLFARQPAVAFQNLLQTLGGFSPTLLAQPPLQTATGTIPPDFGDLGQGLLTGIQAGQRIFGTSEGALSAPFSPAQLPLTPEREIIPVGQR